MASLCTAAAQRPWRGFRPGWVGGALPGTDSLSVSTRNGGTPGTGSPPTTFRPPGDACLSYQWRPVTDNCSLTAAHPAVHRVGAAVACLHVRTHPDPLFPGPALRRDLPHSVPRAGGLGQRTNPALLPQFPSAPLTCTPTPSPGWAR